MKNITDTVTTLTGAAVAFLILSGLLTVATFALFHADRFGPANTCAVLAGCAFVAFLILLMIARDMANFSQQIERIRQSGREE